MASKIILLLLIAVSFAKLSSGKYYGQYFGGPITKPSKPANGYCSLSCEDLKTNSIYVHTACQYDFRPKCNAVKTELTQYEKNLIVNIHNELRRKIASGQETRGINGPQPAAKSMPDLVWDDELANLAQHWANQCNYAHDKCRRTAKEYVGQNMAKSWIENSHGVDVTKLLNNITKITDSLVRGWYNEVQYWNQSDTYDTLREIYPLQKIDKDKYQTGHFTQFVWAKTLRIGCGAVAFTNGFYRHSPTAFYYHLVCNYGQGGNIIGNRIYVPQGDNGKIIQTHLRDVPAEARNPSITIKKHEVLLTWQIYMTRAVVEKTKTYYYGNEVVIDSAHLETKNGKRSLIVNFYKLE